MPAFFIRAIGTANKKAGIFLFLSWKQLWIRKKLPASRRTLHAKATGHKGNEA
jgi:hypothetical protein